MIKFKIIFLLPAGSEEHEVLQAKRIYVAILFSCQFLHNSAFSALVVINWVVII